MTGPSVVMGNSDRVPHETYMQVAGRGQRMSAELLRKAIGASVPLHHVLLRYVYSFMTQTTQTALANGRSKIEERLARWLLMAHDRVDGDRLPLTHEFLAVMLGVRRSGVTVALQELERKGLLEHRRSVIAIVDREGLEHSSNGTYTRPARRLVNYSFVRSTAAICAPVLVATRRANVQRERALNNQYQRPRP
jgi:DNA-binding transcriptional regulator YhcF (GntR family)